MKWDWFSSLDGWLPEERPGSERLFQARVLLWLAVISALVSLFGGTMSALLLGELRWNSLIVIGASPLFALLLWPIKKGQLYWAGVGLGVLFFGMMLGVALSAYGLPSPVVSLVVLLPLLGFFVGGLKMARLYTLGSLLVVFSLTFLHTIGVVFSLQPSASLSYIYIDLIAMCCFMSFCFTLISLFSRALKKAKEELLAAQGELERALGETERADRLKGRFLAQMSHELRTPLSSILGFTELVKEDLDAIPGTERNQVDLDRIHQSATGMLSVINDMLALSRIEAGLLRMESSLLLLSAFFDSLVDKVLPTVRMGGNTLLVEREGVEGWVIADELMLHRVCVYLISHASQVSVEGGEVILRVEVRPVVGGEEERRTIVIEVEDTGTSLSSEQVEHISQVFERGDTGDAQMYEGVGLGLAICSRMCSLIGATLDIMSVPDEGNCFRVTLSVAYFEHEAEALQVVEQSEESLTC